MQFSRYHQIKSIRFYLLQVASQLVLYTTLWRSNLNQCFATCAVRYFVKIRSDVHFVAFWLMLDQSSMIRMLSYHASLIQRYFLFNWRPPTLPCRLQHSTIGRSGLNHRVRDGNGCVPWAHRHQKYEVILLITQQRNNLYSISLERRWSSRTFRYGYLVTTSPQLSDLPSTAPSLRLGHRLRAFPTPMVWRAVCTRPGNVFTAAFWSAITSDSSFM